ncbi:unnamed protein product [Closterium sp. NIES-53]
MDKELKALEERNTWKIVPIGVAQNKTILTGKWVFRVKTKADGTIDKFKARWVVRGFDQEHGRDYTETFAPKSSSSSRTAPMANPTESVNYLSRSTGSSRHRDCGNSTYTSASSASVSNNSRMTRACIASQREATTFS